MSSEPSKPTTGLSFSIGMSLFYAVFFVVGYLGIFAAADLLIRNGIADNEREIIRERLAEYRAWFVTGQIGELRARFEEQSRRSNDLVFVRLAGPGTDSLLFSSPKGQDLLDPARLRELAISDREIVATLVTDAPHNVWTVASTPLPGGYLLQSGRISTDAFAPVDDFRRMFLWATIPVFLLCLFGGGILSYQAMKPVRDLAETAGRIVETGELDRRVTVDRQRGDLAEMGILFNRMLDRNQSLIRSMRESLDHTAHDLRTPMARMRATAETALAKSDDPAAVREALADCVEESDRILAMLNAIMDLAEAETGVRVQTREEVDLTALIRQVTELYDLVAEERQISIEAELPDHLFALGDPAQLQQVIANLVDNAIKYGKPGGTVRILGEVDRGDTPGVPGAIIRVNDDGIGIDAEDLPRIWERLYRADRSRSERGLGLGLSFVKAIVEAHRGDVSVKSEPGKGSGFTVRLPGPPTRISGA